MNAEAIRSAAEYAPWSYPAPPPGLRGHWHHDATGEIWVCASCACRLTARGVSLAPATAVWHGTPEPFGWCVVCEHYDERDDRRNPARRWEPDMEPQIVSAAIERNGTLTYDLPR